MKKLAGSVLGIFMLALCLPFILAEAEAPPENPDQVQIQTIDSSIDLMSLSIANDIPEEGIVRLKIHNGEFIESYLMDTKKDLPKVLKYSALKPESNYGIKLEAIEIKPPGDASFYHSYDRNIPFQDNGNYLTMKRIE